MTIKSFMKKLKSYKDFIIYNLVYPNDFFNILTLKRKINNVKKININAHDFYSEIGS